MRQIVVDESLGNRIAAELGRRGRSAVWCKTLGFGGLTDDEVIEAVSSLDSSAVLVTSDDQMPIEHEDILAEYKLTVATVDPDRPDELTIIEWNHEVVHRWAHAIETQTDGQVKRYGLRSGVWKDRRGRRKRKSPKI